MYYRDLSLGSELSELTGRGSFAHIVCILGHDVKKRVHCHCYDFCGVRPKPDSIERLW